MHGQISHRRSIVLPEQAKLPPTLPVGPDGPFSDLRFTLKDPSQRMAAKVNPRSGIGRFGLIVRVGLRKVYIRLPGKGNSNTHDARPVY